MEQQVVTRSPSLETITEKLVKTNINLYDKVNALTNYTNDRINRIAMKASVDPSALVAVQSIHEVSEKPKKSRYSDAK